MINFLIRKLKIYSKNGCKQGIVFKNMGNDSYSFLLYVRDSYEDCYGFVGDEHICTFERMRLSEETIVINHFAVTKSMQGKGIAQSCLKEFAGLVSREASHINQIEFMLSAMSAGSDKDKLASARKNLFEAIGVRDVKIIQHNDRYLEVRGVWPKINW